MNTPTRTNAAPTVKGLRLSAITADNGLQPREGGCKPATVDEYAEALANKVEFPPLVVYRDDNGRHWLSEGFHRYAAALKAGRKTFPCEVRSGTRTDALVNACGSNATHGLRRSNADKNRAVELLIATVPKWTNRQIAKAAGVSHTFVNNLRSEAAEVETVSTLTGTTNPAASVTRPTTDEDEDEGSACETSENNTDGGPEEDVRPVVESDRAKPPGASAVAEFRAWVKRGRAVFGPMIERHSALRVRRAARLCGVKVGEQSGADALEPWFLDDLDGFALALEQGDGLDE